MFNSPKQAVEYFENVIFINRFCGEFVVMGFFYYEKIASFF